MSAIKVKAKPPTSTKPVTPSTTTRTAAAPTVTLSTTAKRSLVSENPNLVLPHRRHLIDLRVIQRNLVYVIGISPRIATETILRDHDWFGQCGRIVKVVVNRRNLLESATPTNAGPSASAYITYARVEDAAKALAHWDGYLFDGRVMRASYGTTKYCSYFLRGINCPNAGCMYLHEEGQEIDSFTKEQLQREKERAKETPVKPVEPEKPVATPLPPLPPAVAPPVVEQPPKPVSPPLESSSLFGEASSFLQRLASRFGERQGTPIQSFDLEDEDSVSIPSSTAPIPVSFAFLSDEGEVEYTANSLGRRPSSTNTAPSTSILADIWSRSQAQTTTVHQPQTTGAYFDDPAVMMARPANSAPWDPVVLPPGIVNPSPMMTMSVPASQRHHFAPTPTIHSSVGHTAGYLPAAQLPPAPAPPEPKTVVATPLVVSMKPSAAVAASPVVTVTATSQPKVFYQTAVANKKPTVPVQQVTLPPSNPSSSIKAKSTVKTTIITSTPPPPTSKAKQPTIAKKTTPSGTTPASMPSPAPTPSTPANPFSLLMAPVEESDESSELEEHHQQEQQKQKEQPQVVERKEKKTKVVETTKKSVVTNKKRQHDEGWSAEERESFNAQVEAIRAIPLNSLSLPDLVRHIELLDGLCERSRADQDRLEAQLRALLAPIH